MTEASAGSSASLDDFLGTPPPSPWRRRGMLAGVAVVGLLVLYVLYNIVGSSSQPAYATTEVRRGPLTVTVAATGKITPTNQVDVGSEQSGLIQRVLVDNNDEVTVNQPLAEIDPLRLEDAITRSRAGLAAARANVAQAEATVAEAQASLNRLREVSRLSGGRVPAKTEMDTAVAAVARARGGLLAAQANVVSAQAQLSSDTVARERAVIRSPVNGVVLSRQVDPGQTVQASFNTPTLFTIAEDLTRMKLEVSIDEADVGQVKQGQRATFTVDAYPGRTFPAEILRVDLGANASGSGAAASSGSSSSATAATSTVVAYMAQLAVANPELLLRPGMTATADILISERKNALLVPNAALRFTPTADGAPQQKGAIVSALAPPRGLGRRRGGAQESTIGVGAKRTIYVVGSNGQPQPIEVVTGPTDGRNTEVSGDDLKPGMEVITGMRAANGG
jgi:HlyD family secretion protein